MAVLTPHSITPSQWTSSVTWPELQRLVTLATTSLAKLHPDPLAIFKPNLECYEALIHIKPLQVAIQASNAANVVQTNYCKGAFTPPGTAVKEKEWRRTS